MTFAFRGREKYAIMKRERLSQREMALIVDESGGTMGIYEEIYTACEMIVWLILAGAISLEKLCTCGNHFALCEKSVYKHDIRFGICCSTGIMV